MNRFGRAIKSISQISRTADQLEKHRIKAEVVEVGEEKVDDVVS